MNKNVENYKKAVDKIEASENLKENTFKMVSQEKKTTKLNLGQLLAVCASLVVVLTAGIFIFNRNGIIKDKDSGKEIEIAEAEIELPKFKNIDELKETISKNTNSSYRGGVIFDTADSVNESAMPDVPTGATTSVNESKNATHSTTNTQVKGVDEADIVKTDGKYIYYVASGKLVIVDAEKLELMAKIEFDQNYYSSIREIFINGDKVIVFGTTRHKEEVEEDEKDVRVYGQTQTQTERVDTRYYESTYSMATARIYDISDKKNPKLLREVGLEGYYNTARMIDNTIYLVANKSVYYYKGSGNDDNDLLPRILDTAKSDKANRVEVTEISYTEEPSSNSFMLVAAFNIDDKKAANIKTVFGASDEVYCSNNYLYVTDSIYHRGIILSNHKTKILKFKLGNGIVTPVAKGEVTGYVHDQFSMDENDGYLRIATTSESLLGNDTNNLYVLDSKLNQVGELTGIAYGEEIKSVRFVGKVGYVVTYKQIDPLFVIDLSDPKNPTMRGELEIPGYSAYLHPYDDTHIIGIGYDTKTNEWGGTVNSSLKMSMFDVSDLDNPKEIFNVKIGGQSTSSEITYNHKALFYYPEKNLIGFPMNSYSYGATTGFVLYQVDLKNNEFKKFGELKNDSKYWNRVDRVIYIGEDIYSLTSEDITKYDLETAEQKGKVTLGTTNIKDYYIEDEW